MSTSRVRKLVVVSFLGLAMTFLFGVIATRPDAHWIWVLVACYWAACFGNSITRLNIAISLEEK